MFDIKLEPDNSPIEDCNITTVHYFFSDKEAKEFKELCKQGMMKMYPETFADANISDFMLELVRQYNTPFLERKIGPL